MEITFPTHIPDIDNKILAIAMSCPDNSMVVHTPYLAYIVDIEIWKYAVSIMLRARMPNIELDYKKLYEDIVYTRYNDALTTIFDLGNYTMGMIKCLVPIIQPTLILNYLIHSDIPRIDVVNYLIPMVNMDKIPMSIFTKYLVSRCKDISPLDLLTKLFFFHDILYSTVHTTIKYNSLDILKLVVGKYNIDIASILSLYNINKPEMLSYLLDNVDEATRNQKIDQLLFSCIYNNETLSLFIYILQTYDISIDKILGIMEDDHLSANTFAIKHLIDTYPEYIMQISERLIDLLVYESDLLCYIIERIEYIPAFVIDNMSKMKSTALVELFNTGLVPVEGWIKFLDFYINYTDDYSIEIVHPIFNNISTLNEKSIVFEKILLLQDCPGKHIMLEYL